MLTLYISLIQHFTYVFLSCFAGKKKLSQGLFIEDGTHNPLETQEHCDVIALMLIDELKRTTKTSS